MSLTFAAYRTDVTIPVGSHGPLTEDDAFYSLGRMTLDPTPAQERAAGVCTGPNFSETNARMVLRALGYDTDEDFFVLDASELLARATLARAVAPVSDDGFAAARVGNMVDCGLRAGYFTDAYERIAEVCEQALAWGVPVTVS